MYWGPAFWRFMHYYALHDAGRDLLRQVPQFIPCEACRLEWEDLADEQDLVQWSLQLHNKVNRKLGKYGAWDTIDFHIAHKSACDRCAGAAHMTAFPWAFIHAVAAADTPQALQFLKDFDASYPCQACRGTFFTDDPAPPDADADAEADGTGTGTGTGGETVLQWTVRHHQRVDPSYTPPPAASALPLAGDATCVGCDQVSAAAAAPDPPRPQTP